MLSSVQNNRNWIHSPWKCFWNLKNVILHITFWSKLDEKMKPAHQFLSWLISPKWNLEFWVFSLKPKQQSGFPQLISLHEETQFAIYISASRRRTSCEKKAALLLMVVAVLGEGRGGRLRRRWGSQGGSRRCCCGRCWPAAPLAPSSSLAATPPRSAPCCSSSRANWARWKRLMSLMLMAPLIEGDVDVPLLHFLRAHQRNDAFN